MQLESRMEFQHRLEREGRWSAVRIWMDNWRREQASSTKMSSREIKEAVWDEAEKNFPPIALEDQMASTWIPDEQVKRGGADPLRDLLWVYEVFAIKSITPEDAPNSGAWAMLCWARRNREKFFDHLLSKGCSHTAQKKVREVAETKSVSSPEKEKPEDPGLRRINRIFSDSRRKKKKRDPKPQQEPNGSKLDSRVRTGTCGTGVPVVREGAARPGGE